MTKKSPVAVLVVTALTLALVACGPPAEPEEVDLSTQLIQQYWAEGPNYQALALTLFQDYPDLPIVQEKLAGAEQGPLQTEVVRVYAKSDSPEALAALQRLFAEGRGSAPLAAARVLAERGDASGKEMLAERLRDADGLLSPDYCAAMAAIEENACVDEAFKDLGEKKDAAKRAAAALVLGSIDTDRSRQALRERLKDLHGEARVPVIEALAEVGDESDVERLLPLTKFSETVLPTLEALGHLGGEAAIEKLRTYLPLEDKPAARAQAALSLARLGQVDEEVTKALEAGAYSDDVSLRFMVARGLRGADYAASQALLAGLAQDPEASIRDAAMAAVMGQNDEYALAGAKEAYLKGAEAQQGQDYEAAMKALRVIGAVPGKEAQDLLTGALESFNAGYQMQAALALLDRQARGIRITDEAE